MAYDKGHKIDVSWWKSAHLEFLFTDFLYWQVFFVY